MNQQGYLPLIPFDKPKGASFCTMPLALVLDCRLATINSNLLKNGTLCLRPILFQMISLITLPNISRSISIAMFTYSIQKYCVCLLTMTSVS